MNIIYMRGKKSSSIYHGCKTHLILYSHEYIKFCEILRSFQQNVCSRRSFCSLSFYFIPLDPHCQNMVSGTRLDWMVAKNSLSYVVLKSIQKNLYINIARKPFYKSKSTDARALAFFYFNGKLCRTLFRSDFYLVFLLFRHFSDISYFLQILSFKPFGNSRSNCYTVFYT